MARIQLQDVHHAYAGGAHVIRGLNLDIADGEAHAILGGSGAGKTTLLNVLSGLLAPDEGRVMFDGESVTHLSTERRNVAQVFQFPVIYEGMTVADNLAFPLRNRSRTGSEVRDRVAYVGELLGLGGLLAKKSQHLSIYDRQKVSLGRALVRDDVRLLLLDEPLTAVESNTRWELRRVLKQVQAETGLTTIYVTHDQLEALTFADRVSVMVDGAFVQTGTPQDLVEQPAHVFVGHFVGSPGMNLVPVGAVTGFAPPAGAEAMGFRPDWAWLSQSGPGEKCRIERLKPSAEISGVLHGMVEATLHGQEIHTRQPLEGLAVGQGAFLNLRRFCWFAQDRLLRSETL